MNVPQELEALLASLLRRRPPSLGFDQGEEAFDEHRILAMKIHRVAKLAQSAQDREGEAWSRYFRDFFPPGRKDESNAKLLWVEWRTSLLKDETPGPSVAITHGQPHLHWTRDSNGVLAINLEDMWADYEASVHALIALLMSDDERRAVVIERWRQTLWGVRSFIPAGHFTLGAASAANASGATSMTVIKPAAPQKREGSSER